MDTVNRKTEDSSGGRNPSHKQFNILPTLSLAITSSHCSFVFWPSYTSSGFRLFLQCPERKKSHCDWAQITAGVIREVTTAALLRYSSTKLHFPSKTCEGRNKLTSSQSYLLKPDHQLLLTLLHYSGRTVCICLHFILYLCSNPKSLLMVQCCLGCLCFESFIRKATWLMKWAIRKHKSLGSLKPDLPYLYIKKPLFI